MKRHDFWRERLSDVMDRQRQDPFVWGKHDCAIGFAAAIVEAIMGEDPAREYRGKYASPRGALKLMKEAGAETLGDFVAMKLPEHENIAKARVGDIGVVAADGPITEALCMVDVTGLVVMTDAGHGHRPRSDLKRAFKVGD
jgi:hypothetical protein